ncbi:MAG: glycosyltransferase family 39 protein [Geitlerinemataceae cyanobacterium]
MNKWQSRHYLGVLGAIVLGAILRFAQLDFKPLWTDEILTALFSLGRQTQDLPLDVVFSADLLQSVFSLHHATCPQIAQTVVTESTHPPLFFCLMHQWLGWVSPFSDSLAWKLRSLPAVFGIASIAAMYVLNRIAFSPTAGLAAAFLMAVSPFCVYLSQEARHYTLPLLLITLALCGLVQIQQDWDNRLRSRPSVWIGWILANTIGLYVHYFFILAYAAQIATLLTLNVARLKTETRTRYTLKNSIFYGVFLVSPFVLFLPWLPTLLQHFNRPETDWFKPFEPSWTDGFAPIYQTLASWVLMSIALPVESQPLWVAIPAGLLMLAFLVWLGRQFWRGTGQLLRIPETRRSTLTLLGFTFWVLLEIFAMVYILGKDITVAPRYHFIYYPGVCALIGASLNHLKTQDLRYFFYRSPLYIAIVVGLVSSILVVQNWVFQKPYYPEKVARDLTFDRTLPLGVVTGYENVQEVALGLSFYFEVTRNFEDVKFLFLTRKQGYDRVWQALSQSQFLPSPPLNLWVVAPGLRQAEYPPELAIKTALKPIIQPTSCIQDSDRYRRIGIPYQLYRCSQNPDTRRE